MIKLKIYSQIFLLSFLVTSCKELKIPFIINFDEVDSKLYPTILYQKTLEELNFLQKEFIELNNNKLNSQLNRFGLTGETSNYTPHRYPGTILTEKQAVDFAVSALIKKNKFTNVFDSLEIVYDSIKSSLLNLDFHGTIYYLWFKPQYYHDYEIINSSICVGVDGDGIFFIDGSWYDDIYIPFKDNYNIDLSIENIIGEKLTHEGDNDHLYDTTISRDLISKPIQKVIFPLIKKNCIEFRLTWKIPIGPKPDILWYLFFDTVFGEIVYISRESIED
jgi:hypothetical protein